jgi:hypothetical protein
MTLLIDNQLNGPATHVFLIGVGYYRHLPGGEGPIVPDPMEMTQVTTPPLSATAMLTWFAKDYRHPKAPLGTVEALISAPGGHTYNGAQVDPATRANAEAAAARWLQRCSSSVDNVAWFYFCGHGLERDKQYLLLEDFGAQPALEMSTSIDLDRFHDAMTACSADTQVFVADACRQTPWRLTAMMGDVGTPLIQPTIGGNTDRRSPILRAAAQGRSAFGDPGQVTRFTQALLDALRGAGATEDLANEDRWTVSYMSLASAVQTLLGAVPQDDRRQECRTGGEAGDFLIAELPEPPRVPVRVDCIPSETAELAALELSSPLRNVNLRRAPCSGSWSVTLPADYAYRLAATYLHNQYPPRTRTVPVLPPLRAFRVEVNR